MVSDSERQPDAVFFVAAEIRKLYPRVKRVAMALFKVLANADLPQGARSLERAVAALEVDIAAEEVTIQEVKGKLVDDRLAEIKFPEGWDSATGDPGYLRLAD